MNDISKSAFKAKALEYFRSIELTGEPLIITDHGEPKLEIRRYTPPVQDVLAELRGTVIYDDGSLEAIGVEDWAALR